MTMKKSPIWLCLLIVLLHPLLRGQDRPSWAKALPNLPSRPEYYQGLGRAPSTGDANADWQIAAARARSEVASQIRVRITSAITNSIKESSAGMERLYSEAFASTTNQIADATLEGLALERWYDDEERVWYAYGAISRKDVEEKFAEVFHSALGAATVYYAGARKALQEGDAYTGLNQYIEGIKTVFVAEAVLNRTVTGDVNGDGKNEPVLAFLQSQVCNVLGSIRFEIQGGNQQQAEKGRSLSQPLSGRIVYASLSGVVPVKHAVLHATFVPPAQGTLTEETQTDENGSFAVSVNTVDAGGASNVVRIALPFQGTERFAQSGSADDACWKHVYVDFTFAMRVRANVTIAMYIVERNLGRLNAKSTVQQELQKELLAGNYSIVEESKIFTASPATQLNNALDAGNYDAVVHALSGISDVVVIGSVSTRERSNPTPQLFFCTGSIVLRVVDTKTGRILASASLDNEKEGGNSYEVAGTKILQRLGRQLAEEVKSNIDRAMR